jgi:hypothetical protein
MSGASRRRKNLRTCNFLGERFGMDSWSCDLDIDSKFRTVFSADDDRRSQRASKCSANFHPEFVFGMDISGLDRVLGLVLYGPRPHPKLAWKIGAV